MENAAFNKKFFFHQQFGFKFKIILTIALCGAET
jgi:hypothetical protein